MGRCRLAALALVVESLRRHRQVLDGCGLGRVATISIHVGCGRGPVVVHLALGTRDWHKLGFLVHQSLAGLADGSPTVRPLVSHAVSILQWAADNDEILRASCLAF